MRTPDTPRPMAAAHIITTTFKIERPQSVMLLSLLLVSSSVEQVSSSTTTLRIWSTMASSNAVAPSMATVPNRIRTHSARDSDNTRHMRWCCADTILSLGLNDFAI